MTPEARDQAVNDLIDLVNEVDGMLRKQSAADIDYFSTHIEKVLTEEQIERLQSGVHQAYRWQYIFSGVDHPRFTAMLKALTTEAQLKRLTEALAGLR